MTNNQKWIEDTVMFYFSIFSGNYGEDFLNKLLKGGGGNSTLCASWYQLSPVFVPQRIGEAALTLLREKSFDIIEECNTIKVKKIKFKKIT